MKLGKKKNRANESGFSMIEVIVSMFLIFALFVLYLSAMNTVTLTKRSNHSDLAYHIANKQMETLRQIEFDSIVNTGSTAIVDSSLSKLPSGAGTYSISDHASYSGLKEFVVTVTWNDGKNKSVVLRTLAGSGGINP